MTIRNIYLDSDFRNSMIHDYVREYIQAISHPLPELAETFDAELEFLKKHVHQESHVLDVGCGAGRPSTVLAKFVDNIISIDNNQRMIDLALHRAEGLDNIQIIKDDALKMSFENEKFDLVYDTYNLIGSVNEKERQFLINEMYRVCKTGGKIMNITWKDNVETTHFLKRYYPAIGIDVLSIDDSGTVTTKGTFDRFDKEELKKYYERAGLKNIQFHEIGPVWMAIVGEK
jgi:ubiquinone/menaquinone biosynthesis C-methylase UbiE